MAILKERGLESEFFILSNKVVNDDLSWAAMGLLCYLLSKPDDWKVSTAQLINKSCKSMNPTKKDATYKIINELMAKGYMRRVVENNEKGHRITDYIVSSAPNLNENINLSNYEPRAENPNEVKATLQSKELKQSKDKTNNIYDLNDFTEKPSSEAWEDYLLHRKAKKAPMTKTAFKLLVNQINLAVADGQATDDMLAECMLRGWVGFKYSWINIQHGDKQENKNPKPCPYAEIAKRWNDYFPYQPAKPNAAQNQQVRADLDLIWNSKTNKGNWRELEHIETCFRLISKSSIALDVKSGSATFEGVISGTNWDSVCESAKADYLKGFKK